MPRTEAALTAVLAAALALSLSGSAASKAAARVGPRQGPAPRVLLRLTADSGVVGHYKFVANETHRLSYDIPAADPRASLLSSTRGPWQRTTEVALTMVSLAQSSDSTRRYVVYWLGYRLSGDEVRSLTSMQWDSIFRAAGRRASVTFTAVGEPRDVHVSSEAVQPVGEALASILGASPLRLPVDSVAAGDHWSGGVQVPVRRPDGTRARVIVRLDYELRRIEEEADGRYARIQISGQPVRADGDAEGVSGNYFGEAVFSVSAGRFERANARAELEVQWPAGSEGLPPSRSLVEWSGEFSRV
jgi:hypothetical protein